MSRINRHRRASYDLLEIVDYLDRKVGARTAERFLRAAQASFQFLADAPLLAPLAEPPLPHPYGDVRVWPIKRFRTYLIFYRPLGDGIEVMRVLRASRDYQALFQLPP